MRASGWHTARSVRVTMRLPTSPSRALTSLDEPWVVMATMPAHVVQAGVHAVRLGGRSKATSRDPHPVDPALQHRRLAAPPRRVDEHEPLAPLQVVGVVGDGRVGARLEVAVALLGGEHAGRSPRRRGR